VVKWKLDFIKAAFAIIFVFALFLPSLCFGQKSKLPPWELVHEEDGIEVFTRISEPSAVKEIRITLTISSTIDQVSALLGDVPKYTSWVYKSDESRRLETIHANEFYYYMVFDFPFPLSDRDLIVHSQQWIDEQTGSYHSHSTANIDLIPLDPDMVRITDFESTWNIKPIHGGLLYIDYQAKSSPGGEIPIWLANLVITKGPIETMKGFAKEVELQNQKKE
jgi:hypothetical protein